MENELKKYSKEELIDAIDLFSDDIIELQLKNQQLLDRINKAIDEIEYNMQYDDNIDDYWVTTNKLLKILKGE